METTIIGVKDAAKILGVGETRCKELAEQGIIPALRMGRGKWMFNADLLAEAIKNRMMMEDSERRHAALTKQRDGERNQSPFHAKIGRPRRTPPALPQ